MIKFRIGKGVIVAAVVLFIGSTRFEASETIRQIKDSRLPSRVKKFLLNLLEKQPKD
jgi:hypothetical protein